MLTGDAQQIFHVDKKNPNKRNVKGSVAVELIWDV